MIALDEALNELATMAPEQARIVETQILRRADDRGNCGSHATVGGQGETRLEHGEDMALSRNKE